MTATDMISVEVPDIGDFENVPVIELHVSPGDTVAVDDPLLTLESDKATMDVPAPFAGTVRELHVSIGDRVSQGMLLLRMEASGHASAPSKASAIASEGVPNEAAAPDAIESALEVERVAPGEAGAEAGARAEAGAGAEAPSTAEGPSPAEGPSAPLPHDAPDSGRASGGAGPIYASPSVRRMAREMGVDLTGVPGTGRKGRIVRDDVERAASGAPTSPPAAAAGPGLELAPWPAVDFAKYGPVERVARSRIQKISAPNLARNWVTIPHVTHNDEADITELEAWRKQLNAEQQPDGAGPAQSGEAGGRPGGRPAAKVTMVSFLVVACVAALREFPIFNSSLDGDDLVLKRYYNIGFAADTPGGLVVPVIKDADSKGLLEIAAELGALSARARDGKLGPADMQGSTFTISSLGGIGGTSFTPIVNAPEVAILGVTRAATKPVWNGEEFVPRLMVPLSLSYDHRVIDGAAAARFVVHLTRVLTDLRRALL